MSTWALTSFVMRRAILAIIALAVQVYLAARITRRMQGTRAQRYRPVVLLLFAAANTPFLFLLVDWTAGLKIPSSWFRSVIFPFVAWQVASFPAALVMAIDQLWGYLSRRKAGPTDDKAADPARRKVILSAATIVTAGSVATVSYGLGLGARDPRIVTVKFPIKGLHPDLNGFRIVQLTDIHVGYFYDKERLQRLSRLVLRLSPDLVALTGDMVHGFHRGFVPELIEGLRDLKSKVPLYAVLGNHDRRVGALFMRNALQGAGWSVLHNRHVYLRRGGGALVLAGVDDGRGCDLESALRGRPPSTPVVLLSHRPDIFLEAVDKGVGLVLAGHTHGGQVCIGGFNLLGYWTKYLKGRFKQNDTWMYVCPGVGLTGPPIRLGVPSEILQAVLWKA